VDELAVICAIRWLDVQAKLGSVACMGSLVAGDIGSEAILAS
jgi:hypothetical protein